MLPLIDPKEGRLVHTSSGVASMYLKGQSAEIKALFSNPDITLEALEAAIKEQVAAGNAGLDKGYGISKCALTALTLVHAKKYANLKVVSLSPGFIDTAMTKGYGAKLTPEQVCLTCVERLSNVSSLPRIRGMYLVSNV